MKIIFDEEDLTEIFDTFSSEDSRDDECCVYEDTENKMWHFYHKHTKDVEIVPFGEIVNDVLNVFTASDKKNVRYELLKERSKNAGAADLFADMESFCKEYPVATNYLHNFIIEIPHLKNKYTANQFHNICFTAWKRFRICNRTALWELFLQYCDDILSPLSKDAKDELRTLDNFHKKHNCIYYNTLLLNIDGSNQPCRAFWIRDYHDIFYWDLFHVLMGDTTIPKECPRCRQFFTPESNYFKYCAGCAEKKSDIRKMHRIENPERVLHKRINDKLHTLKEYRGNFAELDRFMIESNYYWDVVRGKKTATRKQDWYDDSITTKEQYREWLQRKLDSYSVRKK